MRSSSTFRVQCEPFHWRWQDAWVGSALGTFGRIESDDDDAEVSLLIRPEDVIHEEGSETTGKILKRTFRGASLLYELELDNGETVEALVPSRCIHEIGEKIGIRASVEHTVAFPADVG